MKSFKQFLVENNDDFTPTHFGYHGTPDKRDIMKDGFRTVRERVSGSDPDAIYWATKDQRTARTYADDRRALDYQNAEPAVLPVQLQMKNPKVIDWGGKKFRGVDEKTGERYEINDHINQARLDGHDGFIVKNMKDTYDAKGRSSTIMGVFHHKNIRVKK